MSDLLPCPFCGCTTIKTEVQDDLTRWHECDWCNAVGPVEQPDADPPEGWNIRAAAVAHAAPQPETDATTHHERRTWLPDGDPRKPKGGV